MSDKKTAVITEAPAVIDDTLPGGARWMHNLGDEPVWVETKTQLRDELAKRGLVQAERNSYNRDDKSPWATRTRLKADAVDPFLPKNQTTVDPPKDEKPAELLGPDGRPIGSTVTLDYPTASQLRGYFSWIVRAGFEPELFCAECNRNMRSSRAKFDIDEQAIDITCDCRRIVYAGPTKFARITPTLPPPIPDGIALIAPSRMTLSTEEAEVLRAWKTILLRLGLKEALRCNACFEANRADGVEARVLTAEIRIACRCRCYTFAGYTY